MSKYKDDFTVLDETTAQVGDIITIRGQIACFRDGDRVKVTDFDLYEGLGHKPFIHRGHYFRAGPFRIVVYVVAQYSVTTGEHIADIQVFPRDTDHFEDRHSDVNKPRLFKKAIALLRDAGMHAASAILEDEREEALTKARQNRRSRLGQRERRDQVKAFKVTARMCLNTSVRLKMTGGRDFVCAIVNLDNDNNMFTVDLMDGTKQRQCDYHQVIDIKPLNQNENLHGQ
jgi:hypothetical protein